jgi:hypothetical protein
MTWRGGFVVNPKNCVEIEGFADMWISMLHGGKKGCGLVG